MAEGWICIARKITEWEWYSDPNVFRLFIHLLLKANYRDQKWQGILVSRGQFVTSRGKISEQIGLSIKQIRGAEAKLVASDTISANGANRFTLYTILNYDDYQDGGIESATKGQTKGKPKANKGQQLNKDNNANNENNLSLFPDALPDWLPVREWEAFKNFRRKIKHTLTDEAIPIALQELAKLRGEGHDPVAVLNQSILRGWRGLFPIKTENTPKGQQHGKHGGFAEQDYYAGTDGFDVT